MGVVEISGAINFRDTGGLPASGGMTRAGVLFRSGSLVGLDDQGRQALAALGLRRVIDLRAIDEVDRAPSPVDPAHVRVQRTPLFRGSVTSFFDEDVPLREMYRRVLRDSGPHLVEVVRGILADQPVLVHCTAGKDRTGVTIAVTLAAAGVDRDAVVADYARSEALLPAERNEYVMDLVRRYHPDARHAEELVTRSPAPVMHALLGDLEREYGSAAGFLRTHGMTDGEVHALRDALVGPSFEQEVSSTETE